MKTNNFRHELFQIIIDGNIDKLKLFIIENPNIPWKCTFHKNSNDTAIITASRLGHISIVKFLHKVCLNDITASNAHGKTPLHEAAHHCQVSTVEYILEESVPVDPLKHADWTPLMLACTKSCLRTIELLVSHGASIELKNKDGWTPFHIACREGHLPIIDYFCLLKKSIWNTFSNNGRSPLHTACINGSYEAVKVLFKHGASPDLKDICGNTPLMDAARAGHVDTVKFIIEGTPQEIYSYDNLGHPTFHIAAQAGQVLVMDFLLRNCKYNINAKSEIYHSTALHLAVKACQLEAIQFLLTNEADVNIADSKGRTILDLAFQLNNNDCIKLLLGSTDA